MKRRKHKLQPEWSIDGALTNRVVRKTELFESRVEEIEDEMRKEIKEVKEGVRRLSLRRKTKPSNPKAIR